jgi:hypothetical protein
VEYEDNEIRDLLVLELPKKKKKKIKKKDNRKNCASVARS